MAGGGRSRPDVTAARHPRGASVARPRPAAGGVAGAPGAAAGHQGRPQARQARALYWSGMETPPMN